MFYSYQLQQPTLAAKMSPFRYLLHRYKYSLLISMRCRFFFYSNEDIYTIISSFIWKQDNLELLETTLRIELLCNNTPWADPCNSKAKWICTLLKDYESRWLNTIIDNADHWFVWKYVISHGEKCFQKVWMKDYLYKISYGHY